jgi:hypothetical protein
MKRTVLGLALLLIFAGIAQAQTAVPVATSAPYGTDGKAIPLVYPATLPSYVYVNTVNANVYAWDSTHTTWFNDTTFRLTAGILDGQPHRLTLYLLDYDHMNRNEQVVISTPQGTQLAQAPVTNFTNGVYLSWIVTGYVVIDIKNTGGLNAVCSGIFFDPPTTPTSTATAPILPQLIYSVTLNITPVPGALSYKVYRGTMSGGPYPVLVGTTSTLVNGVYSVTDTTVSPGSTYYYVTTSVSAGGESGFSPEIQAKP